MQSCGCWAANSTRDALPNAVKLKGIFHGSKMRTFAQRQFFRSIQRFSFDSVLHWHAFNDCNEGNEMPTTARSEKNNTKCTSAFEHVTHAILNIENSPTKPSILPKRLFKLNGHYLFRLFRRFFSWFLWFLLFDCSQRRFLFQIWRRKWNE